MTIALGINAGTNTWHDASACLVDDTGRVLAFIEQERLTRLRHAPKDHAPAEAVAAVLTAAGITAEEVDAIAVGWDEPRARAHIGDVWRFDSPAEFLRDLGLAGSGRVPDLQFIPHHRAHAASAFYASPYPAAAVLVVDGNGEDESVNSTPPAAGTRWSARLRGRRPAASAIATRPSAAGWDWASTAPAR